MLVAPSEHEMRAHLTRSSCNPALEVDIHIRTGVFGSRLCIDGIAVRGGLKPSEAMAALHEGRRLALVAAHDALCELAACLAKIRST